ncbi:MAG: MBL fold metallo-hydrolase [Phycisphaerales bacterium]|nr:MBL fold metallo-hydrolase [Phycisphaerales bacterium]
MPRLLFHGAAGEVTGSMHLVEANGALIALDCGLFQGRRAETEEKNRTFPCDARDIKAVVLSHAHIDHCGRLPKLVKDGFSGSIHCTFATRDLAAILLQDSAHIQEEDAKYLNKKRRRNGLPPIDALYDPNDVPETLRLTSAHAYNRWFHVVEGVRGQFIEAGHMLGSAGVLLEITENEGKTVRVFFTGDVGRWGVPILRDPQPIPPCDYIISESTYGGRTSPPVADMKAPLRDAVKRTIARRGKVIIPAFSVGRTQTLLYNLNMLFNEGELSPIPVYVDSPLAINATDVFKMHPECYDRDARTFFREVGHLLSGPNVHFIRETEGSKALNRRRTPCVVIAASGMCEAGRILHHLKHGVNKVRNTIMIVGYQAMHTLGRRIVERVPEVKIYGRMYDLKAEVVVLNGFSSHADANELRRHLAPRASENRGCFLVHGEPDQSEKLRATLKGDGYRNVHLPERGAEFTLDGSA